MESKKQQFKKQIRNRLVHTENILMVARWEGVRGRVKTVRGLRSTNWLLQNGHKDEKHGTGNIVTF